MSSSANAVPPYWENWTGNLQHMAPTDGANYYFTPTNLSELKAVIASATQNGVTVRVSGQRHSQSALVADDNRSNPPQKPDTFLVDMSCYVDVGTTGIALGPGPNQVTVNPGVREDAVDAFLTQNNLMFKTVTAGGFFSIGGMTAVDVHGGTVNAPIFAETASAFTILGADGNLTTINANSTPVNGWSPLQFARGWPHNGKMYGFYDPTAAAGTHTAAFNPNFLADLRKRRGQRLTAFKDYRQACDPSGLFYDHFLRQLLEG